MAATDSLLAEAKASADELALRAYQRSGHANAVPLALAAIAAELRVLTILLEARDAD